MATSVASSSRSNLLKEKVYVKKKKCSSEKLSEILKRVFPVKSDGTTSDQNASLGFNNLDNHINQVLTGFVCQNGPSSSNLPSSSRSPGLPNRHKGGYMKVLFGEKKQKFVHTPSHTDNGSVEGRLGSSSEVGLQTHPLDTVPGDNLAVIGNTNFQSIKASHCVYKGKWMYEVLLGTPGLMQVGWCTLSCKFNREEGVGDTKNSFAYDGYREAKWTSRCSNKYGEPWEADDVVTCLIDLDNRTASFCLNGKNLGIAFDNIPSGPGIAYFPGLSLAYKEVAYCNFGLRPFRYPVAGYRPIQDPPTDHLEAGYLFQSLSSMTSLTEIKPDLYCQLDVVSEQVIFAHIFQRLGPVLKSIYNVEAYFLPFLLAICNNSDVDRDERFRRLHLMLSCLWQYTEAREARDCINNLFGCALRRYRSAPVHVDFTEQTKYLTFMLGLFRHHQTRRNLALHCSFDRQAEIPSLFYIKQVSKHREAGLNGLIPMIWAQDRDPKTTYEKGYEKLKEKMDHVKTLQREIMELMVLDGNAEETTVSGAFVKYFRRYLESIVSTTRPEHTLVCHHLVLHSFIQRMVDVIRKVWDQYASLKPNYVTSADGFIPIDVFYNDSIDYFDLQRVGGLKSHLFNEHKDELEKEGVSVIRGRSNRRTTEDSVWTDNAILQLFDEDAGSSSFPSLARTDDDTDLETFNPVLRLARALLNQSNKMSGRDRSVTVSRKRSSSGEREIDYLSTKPPLLELTDGCLLLYTNVVHQHMDKIHSTRTKIVEYATALNDIEMKLNKCSDSQHDEVRLSLSQSHAVLLRHMTELCRSIAWLKASVYAPESQENLWWLLRVSIRTAHNASEKGALFTFMPEFYLTAAARLYKCLREYFSPSQPFEKLPDLQSTLMQFIHFLSIFHCDSRIISNDIKTMLANTITTFITYPMQLRAIEAMSEENLHTFVRNLLYAYDEEKPWTSVGHRLLATLWRGSGFAMRYDHPPYVAKVKTLLNRDHDPYVPERLLSYVRELLLEETVLAGKFVHSILEHLNWSFSEFIGQLQEVHQQNTRGWGSANGLLASLDAQALRQLRIVDMLFELSVSLMRVLELTIAVAPGVFFDWSAKDTAETLINQLVQCTNQILNRVTTKDNIFDKIVSGKRPGLSSLQHYPLMTAAAGILLRLLNQTDDTWKTRATDTLVNDPGFNITSVEFLLNMRGQLKSSDVPSTSLARGPTIPYTRSKDKKFVSLEDYEEVMDEEVSNLRDTIYVLREAVEAAAYKVEQPMDEDNLCTICYANEIAVEFHPCRHTSCRQCIKQQLMSSQECFYCKTKVEKYTDITSTSKSKSPTLSSFCSGPGPSTSSF